MGSMRVFLPLFLGLLCCACGSNEKTTSVDIQEVSQSITYDNTLPMNTFPDMRYAESWLVSGATMSISRIGGAQVNSGTWTIELDKDEISNINASLAVIIEPAVEDAVYDVIVYDGPCKNLYIGDVKEFHYAMVHDPVTDTSQWHEFPAEVSDFVGYLEQVMIAHTGDRYAKGMPMNGRR